MAGLAAGARLEGETVKSVVLFLVKWAVIFLIVSVAAFVIVRMMPTTPVEKWLDAYHLPHTDANVAFLTHRMGLDQPQAIQYRKWISHFFMGDWGVSLVSGEDIRGRFLAKMPYSFSIGIAGIVAGGIAAFFLGYRAALYQGGFSDRLSAFATVFAQCVPQFIVAILIINALGVRLKVVTFFTGDGKWALVSAITITALYCAGILSRVVRAAFREEMGKSYVKFAVSRGFSKEEVLLKHAYKPVVSKLISAMTTRFAGVFGGSTVLEFAFAIPGLSTMLVSSMDSRDYNVLQTYILVVIIWMFLVHAVFNITLGILNARDVHE